MILTKKTKKTDLKQQQKSSIDLLLTEKEEKFNLFGDIPKNHQNKSIPPCLNINFLYIYKQMNIFFYKHSKI